MIKQNTEKKGKHSESTKRKGRNEHQNHYYLLTKNKMKSRLPITKGHPHRKIHISLHAEISFVIKTKLDITKCIYIKKRKGNRSLDICYLFPKIQHCVQKKSKSQVNTYN